MWRATDNMTIGGSLVLLDGEFTDFDNAQCPASDPSLYPPGTNGQCNLSGADTPLSPDYAGNVFLDYEQGVSDALMFNMSLDANFSDEYFLEGDADPENVQDSYIKFNVRLALASSDDKWEVALLGKNLSNEQTSSNGTDIPLLGGGYFRYLDDPRSYSLLLTYNFF